MASQRLPTLNLFAKLREFAQSVRAEVDSHNRSCLGKKLHSSDSPGTKPGECSLLHDLHDLIAKLPWDTFSEPVLEPLKSNVFTVPQYSEPLALTALIPPPPAGYVYMLVPQGAGVTITAHAPYPRASVNKAAVNHILQARG